MRSLACELAINDALKHEKALLKYIQPNEVVHAQSHQLGYLIPKPAAHFFTPQKPEKGVNHHHDVTVRWQGDQETQSHVIWYGKGTRSEYRITKFGRDFPWAGNRPELVGDLLVLIPTSLSEFHAFIIEDDDEIEDLLAALGVEILGTYALYQGQQAEFTSEECIGKEFREFAAGITEMPSGDSLSRQTHSALSKCLRGFDNLGVDDRLIRLMRDEYQLYKLLERKLHSSKLTTPFKSIDEFLELAVKILNARKSRAGRSLENHVDYLLTAASVPHKMRAKIPGVPDVVIPDERAYFAPDANEKTIVLAVKTTCKDRWRQVAKEAPNVERKFLLTLQEGISSSQLRDIADSNIQLVVPASLHVKYPQTEQHLLWKVDDLITHARRVLR